MVKPLLAVTLVLAISAHAETFRFFGSAGAEMQHAPANDDSPLAADAGLPNRTALADATFFADASSRTSAWKIHLKARATASDDESEKIEAGEAYVHVGAAPWLDITAGRVIEKWGTGYAWNPTGFLNPAKDPADANDRLSAYRGRDMIKADVFVADTTLSLYALEGGSYAIRAYRLVAGTDLSLQLHHGDHATSHGVSISRVFGEALELHAEVTSRRALLGGQYTFADGTNIVVEAYHTDDGLSDHEWREYRRGTTLEQLRGYAPLRMGRDYAFVRLSRSVSRLEIAAEAVLIANVRDGSFLSRLELTRQLKPNVSVYVIATEFAGGSDTELGLMPIDRQMTAGLRVYF